MPKPDTRHAKYEQYEDQWQRCRDVIEGEDAVKARRTAYLPYIGDPNDTADSRNYDGYLQRAMFYGATGRTVAGLAGAIERKPPEIKYPQRNADILKSITSDRKNIQTLLKNILMQQLGLGRLGLLVDSDLTENSLPYITLYKAENVVNWRTAIINGREELSMVVLREFDEVIDGNDPFVTNYKEQYRVLNLVSDDSTETGFIYRVEIWQEVETTRRQEDNFVRVFESVPLKFGGKPLSLIPFVFINAFDSSPTPSRPPLIDLVNVNLSHYINSADREHALHFTALPQPWVSGVDNQQKLTIGSAYAWMLPDQAQAGYLEFAGSGVNSIQETMEKKEALMAVLGARLLEERRDTVEAAETLEIRKAGEESTLVGLAMTTEESLDQALSFVYEWQTGRKPTENDILVTLNKDYISRVLDAGTLQALVMALQQNVISFETFYYNLHRGEIYNPSTSIEEERRRVKKQKEEAKPDPVAPPQPAPQLNSGGEPPEDTPLTE